MLSIFIGLGLAAAAGFRVFIPLLVMSVAVRSGMIEPSAEFAWVGSLPALIAFSVAAVAEVGAYYLPFIDNALDMITSPLAVVAGAVLTAAIVADVGPFLKWTMAIIAGGGVAGTVQTKTVVTRGASSVTTAGIANPVLATVELGGSLITSILAVVVPVLGILVGLAILIWLFVRTRRRTAETDAAVPS